MCKDSRVCRTCGESKELNSKNFYPSKYHEGGYNTQCIDCNVAKTIAAEKEYERKNKMWKGLESREAERKEKEAKRAQMRNGVYNALRQGHKTCSCCGQDKELSEFYVDKRHFSGYSSYCKECKKAMGKQRYLSTKEG